MANQIDLRNVNIAALGRELGLKDMEGYKEVENKNPKDGYVYIKKDTEKNKGEFLTLKSNGAVFFKKYFISDDARRLDMTTTYKPAISAHKAKIIQAALGEKVDAEFAKKYAKEIQEMKDKLFAPDMTIIGQNLTWGWGEKILVEYHPFFDYSSYRSCPCSRGKKPGIHPKKKDTGLLLPGGYVMAPFQIHWGSRLDNEKKPTNKSEHPRNSVTKK